MEYYDNLSNALIHLFPEIGFEKKQFSSTIIVQNIPDIFINSQRIIGEILLISGYTLKITQLGKGLIL